MSTFRKYLTLQMGIRSSAQHDIEISSEATAEPVLAPALFPRKKQLWHMSARRRAAKIRGERN